MNRRKHNLPSFAFASLNAAPPATAIVNHFVLCKCSLRCRPLRISSFAPHLALCHQVAKSSPITPSYIRCSDDTQPQNEDEQESKAYSKFDPESSTDAFGRDPRKETQFWMGAAKSVLDSDEVRKAIEDHGKDGGDGLTDEQRAYQEFIKSLDADKEDGS